MTDNDRFSRPALRIQPSVRTAVITELHPPEQNLTCTCGSQRFTFGTNNAVCLTAEGSIFGYSGALTCRDCGKARP